MPPSRLEGRRWRGLAASSRARPFGPDVTHWQTVIDVVFDASVALKWFRAEGESEIEPARALLDAHRSGEVLIASVLDLTAYEIGNALIRRVEPEAVSSVLGALAAICTAHALDAEDRHAAAVLAAGHGLTFYDAAYASVAQRRGGVLATADRQLLDAGLGESPAALAQRLALRNG